MSTLSDYVLIGRRCGWLVGRVGCVDLLRSLACLCGGDGLLKELSELRVVALDVDQFVCQTPIAFREWPHDD